MKLWNVFMVVALAEGFQTARAADGAREVPAAFAPFEYLVGSWKGSGVPSANRVRGWSEKHSWAWRFEKGKPVGMSVTMTGDKVLAEAKLAYDPGSKTYRLEGTDPEKKPVTFTGTLDKAGKKLTLDRVGAAPDGSKQQVTLFPNGDFIRYSLQVAQKEPGSPQYKKTIEVGLTKEGESFAAGSSAADLPKCIVTGGAATMTVTYEGKTYPLCCSGCQAEFDENPVKYVKKASLRAAAGSSKASAKPASSVGKDDGSFDGLADEPKAKANVSDAPAPSDAMKPDPKGSPRRDDSRKPGATPADKAASLLRLGQNLEKAGKTAAALKYYNQVVKDYPKTPAAKTAAARSKALTSD